ncbi:hypothetical protein CU098_010422 [Rhizopus stolonifer]|uniref:Uncharacterized protein n=1 Tax=Rhizopus stolonifer TaxID=4846 RepID=A0A367K9E5_RHIST|nr:hypothetical protein CU098_010422 [Rhizopus stolonifer]
MYIASIYSPNAVDPIILEKGYIQQYVSPYSSELNPVEMFWKVLKDRVRRAAETLSSRVTKGSEDVPY